MGPSGRHGPEPFLIHNDELPLAIQQELGRYYVRWFPYLLVVVRLLTLAASPHSSKTRLRGQRREAKQAIAVLRRGTRHRSGGRRHWCQVQSGKSCARRLSSATRSARGALRDGIFAAMYGVGREPSPVRKRQSRPDVWGRVPAGWTSHAATCGDTCWSGSSTGGRIAIRRPVTRSRTGGGNAGAVCFGVDEGRRRADGATRSSARPTFAADRPGRGCDGGFSACIIRVRCKWSETIAGTERAMAQWGIPGRGYSRTWAQEGLHAGDPGGEGETVARARLTRYAWWTREGPTDVSRRKTVEDRRGTAAYSPRFDATRWYTSCVTPDLGSLFAGAPFDREF